MPILATKLLFHCSHLTSIYIFVNDTAYSCKKMPMHAWWFRRQMCSDDRCVHTTVRYRLVVTLVVMIVSLWLKIQVQSQQKIWIVRNNEACNVNVALDHLKSHLVFKCILSGWVIRHIAIYNCVSHVSPSCLHHLLYKWTQLLHQFCWQTSICLVPAS